jgi:pimeloyl-ACP methyl ester carboxylesterase
VFVHGVFGDRLNTWTNNDTRTSLPELLASDPAYRGFDVYLAGYRSPLIKEALKIEDVADQVRSDMIDDSVFHRRSIIFVAHSMGGLVAKRIILRYASVPDTITRIRALIGIAVPNQGAPVAEVGAFLSFNRQLRDLLPTELNSYIAAIGNDWRDLLERRDASARWAPRFYCARETRPMFGTVIVSSLYGNDRCDGGLYPLEGDHSSIVKPSARGDATYRWVTARIETTRATIPERPADARVPLARSPVSDTCDPGWTKKPPLSDFTFRYGLGLGRGETDTLAVRRARDDAGVQLANRMYANAMSKHRSSSAGVPSVLRDAIRSQIERGEVYGDAEITERSSLCRSPNGEYRVWALVRMATPVFNSHLRNAVPELRDVSLEGDVVVARPSRAQLALCSAVAPGCAQWEKGAPIRASFTLGGVVGGIAGWVILNDREHVTRQNAIAANDIDSQQYFYRWSTRYRTLSLVSLSVAGLSYAYGVAEALGGRTQVSLSSTPEERLRLSVKMPIPRH